MRRITVEWLRKFGACPGQVAIVEREWPRGIPVTVASARRAARLLNVDWLINHLPHDLRDAYRRGRKPQLAAYDRGRKPLLTKYQRVLEPVWDEYKRECDRLFAVYDRERRPVGDEYQRVCKRLWDEYQRACRPLLDEYQRGRRPLWGEYQRAIACVLVPLLRQWQPEAVSKEEQS